MVPGAVIADVFCEEGLDVRELLVPDGEVTDQPLAVGPHVVVFGVFGEHLGEEGEFGGRYGGDVGHDYLAVVPTDRCQYGQGSGRGESGVYQIW